MGTDGLSPLDGRYQGRLGDLRQIFSETGLNRHRVWVEVNYLIELASFLGVVNLSGAQKKALLSWAEKLTEKDLLRVKEIEKKTNHDVKAVEYFIRENLKKLKLEALSPWIHWGLTSEDTNNLTYGLMMQKAVKEVILPQEKKLLSTLAKLAGDNKNAVMMARTHGQAAVPTTIGKELAVFADRSLYFLEKINSLKLTGKINGAVGNFNAYVQLYPEYDWQKFSRNLITKLGLEVTELSTQVEAGGSLVYLLDLLRQSNNVWLDLSRDMWWYIAQNYCVQKKPVSEVGSSTMPQKVNPIEFENAEGNLELANSLLTMMSNKLPVSRLQRDLSDSTVKRNLGVALGHTSLALQSLEKGLLQLSINKELMKKEVEMHPEMLAELKQLKMKVAGDDQGYEKVRSRLPQTGKVVDYIGLAPQLTDQAIKRINKFIKGKI
jgi:adenylosuccinate lyase